ncbi:hypothetical protein OSB04_014067 [Centaurea solstitialis]|uniref:Protein kinase domain-containing protein n=1 Tax=Centaurea solstitialis TaxID=347529 RepID=A0AA38TEE8_9ASTR|nr:hypothetical protein OSB04_014067 [Centaurea solstitialis]
MSGLREAEHLKLQLQEIRLATNNFETCIGKGGYGWVYKGQLSIAGKPTTVAVKRLNEQLGQGLKEFLTEIQLLTGQNHPNLISLLGYCDEGNEKIIVYEYAERGSLDKYLISSNAKYAPLTWLERLRICIDAARGLDHLHNHVGKHQTIIHRDIKSANILLDENWVAKISDLGLSKLSLAGLNRSAVISHACGTPGYCEPEYIITGIVKRESDVYSFGMVLFEVLCGRLCSYKHDGLLLSARLAKEYYEKKKLIEIIDPLLREQMSWESMNKFSAIAYRCVLDDRRHRPPINLVVQELVGSLRIQEEYESAKLKCCRVLESDSDEYWVTKLPQDYEDIVEKLIPTVSYTSKKEIFALLHEGILFDDNKRFFSINKDGKKCELISAITFIDSDTQPHGWVSQSQLRFDKLASFPYKEQLDIPCQIRTSMLSYNTMYAATLVFKYETEVDFNSQKYIEIKWKVYELNVSSTHLAKRTKDGWLRIKMWYFVNYKKQSHFEMVLDKISDVDSNEKSGILIQGIEFEPIEMKAEHISKSDDDIDWEQNFPCDYEDLVQRSDKQLEYTTRKELYILFCKGILIDNGKLWFSLCKLTGKKCHMLPAREIIAKNYDYKNLDWISLPESRFGEVARIRDEASVLFTCEARSAMFSPCSFYSSYLVFKFLNDDESGDGYVLEADYRLDGKHESIPIIKPKEDDQLENIEGLRMPNWKQREVVERKVDGWMEVKLCKSLYELEGYNLIEMGFRSTKMLLCGIIVQGIEFRPMQL